MFSSKQINFEITISIVCNAGSYLWGGGGLHTSTFQIEDPHEMTLHQLLLIIMIMIHKTYILFEVIILSKFHQNWGQIHGIIWQPLYSDIQIAFILYTAPFDIQILPGISFFTPLLFCRSLLLEEQPGRILVHTGTVYSSGKLWR